MPAKARKKESLLAEFVAQQRLEISKQEGYLAEGKLIPWHEMAHNAGLTEPTMMRIKRGDGIPTYENILRLARYLPDGNKIFGILDLPQPAADLPEGIRWLLEHQDTSPEARRLLEAIEQAAKNNAAQRGIEPRAAE